MFCNIVVIGVQNDEKSFAIAVVVVAASCCFAVFGIIRVIEMIGIIRIQGIVVTDRCCYRKRFQSICTQIGSVLLSSFASPVLFTWSPAEITKSHPDSRKEQY